MKPNILWIITDQQSFQMMSCAGNDYISTPNMDYIAKHGVRFENAYCSNPLCIPSRLGMITGTYPGEHGIRRNEDRPSQPWPPSDLLENGAGKLMKEAGYHAAYGGKEHFPCMRATDLGFDYITANEREELASISAEFIRNYHDEKPFFLVTSFVNPHDICFFAINDAATPVFGDFVPLSEEEIRARRLPEDYNEREKNFGKKETEVMQEACRIPEGMNESVFFETVCPPLPDNHGVAEDEPEAIEIAINQRYFKKEARENYTDQRWRFHRWCYKNLTEKVDKEVGTVLFALIESGKWDDTVIIFVSDHGDIDGSHKLEHKEVLYEEAVHVPLIIKGISKDAEGVVVNGIVQTGTDILPTIFDYAGVTPPQYFRGLSLREAAETGIFRTDRGATVIESEFGMGAVSVTGKYVRYDVGERNEQYYNFETNRGEMYNQLKDESFRQDVDLLRETLNLHLQDNKE